jgi:hypothetical protein
MLECEKQLSRRSNKRTKQTSWLQRRELKDQIFFNKTRKMIGPHAKSRIPAPGSLGQFSGHVTDPGSAYTIPVHLAATNVDLAFEQAFARPLDMAKSMIATLANLEGIDDHLKLVVVSGGSAKPPEVRRRLRGYCNESNVRVLFIDEMEDGGYGYVPHLLCLLIPGALQGLTLAAGPV